MTGSLKLEFKILSFWRVGTGAGLAASLDSRCARDADGLPMVPGKQVRGLLRDAVRQAVDIGWVKDVTVEALFGSRADEVAVEGVSDKGCLRVEDARLAVADIAGLRGNDKLIAGLFQGKRSTAMDPSKGTAKPKSLRFDEVAIPVTLYAEVSMFGRAPTGWREAIAKTLPLIRELGADRTRGLGRVIVKVEGGNG